MPTKIKGLTGVDKVEAGAVITNPSFSGNATVTGSLTVGGVNVFSGPYRNLIINGDMQIAQRGTSSAGVTSSGYTTVDRWTNSIGTAGTWTISQDTDVPTGQGFSNSHKYDCTTANASLSAGSEASIIQMIEAQNLQHLKFGTSSAEQLTVSFWVKSNKTGTYIFELYQWDDNRAISKSYTIDTANTWEKKTITIDADTTGVIDNNNDKGFQCAWWIAAGSNNTSGTLQTSWGTLTSANRAVGQVNLADSTSNYINITGVQLEVGEGASDFEFLPYDVQLARCQRYYYKSPDGYSYGDTWIVYQASTGFAFNGRFPVTMRTNPSITFGHSTHYTGNTIYRIDTGQVITVTVTSLPTTPDKPTLIYQAGTHSLVVGTSWSTWITASAEL